MTALALVAGFGFGLAAGGIGAAYLIRKDQSWMLDFLSRTVDRLVASSLYPGMQTVQAKIQPQVEGDGMFDDQGVDQERIPKWMEDEAPVWDYTQQEEPVG